MLVFMAFLALASASAIKESGEERFLVTTNAGSFLTLNSTTLTTVALGGLLVVLLALVLLGPGLVGDRFRAYKRHGQAGQGFYSEEPEEFQTRYKRFAPNDIASKMAQLEQAFKKYQVTEAECEMYIACEASQVNRHEENGPLAKIIFDIISTFNRAKDGHKWDDRMEGLVQAFEYGTGAQAAGQVDACEPLRNKCFELHASTKY